MSVSSLDAIIADLKRLPPGKLDQAGEYIRELSAISRAERVAALERTYGSLSNEQADELERAINEDCERVDERDW